MGPHRRFQRAGAVTVQHETEWFADVQHAIDEDVDLVERGVDPFAA